MFFLLRQGKNCAKKNFHFVVMVFAFVWQLYNNTWKKKKQDVTYLQLWRLYNLAVTATADSDVKEREACHQRHYNLCDPSSGRALPGDERPLRGMDLVG